LDINDAERKLSQLEKRINKINNTLNNSGNSGNKINQQLDKAVNNTNKLDSANKKAATSANSIAKGYKNANSAVSVLTKNMRTLISTYLGVMGAKAVFGTSDAITSAQNKLNYVNGGNESLTQDQMTKTYAAAQRSRGDYLGMLGNVSKTMTLAGDAFDNNVDNAIRFQEIMSKAYTVGGASAAEQASSMYQLVQALGSGILQGDELRSVREGAPIAYKEIEKFAQGVYKTEESLKDMASQGKITSDIVVAAMMNAGKSIDDAFADTDMTFAQALTNIKNMAVQAFTPVLDTLNDVLKSNPGKAIIEGIGTAFVVLANAILWVMDILGSFFNWCYDNWYWLQWVVFGVATAIIVYLSIMAAQAIWTGLTMFWSFLVAMKPMYWIIILIGAAVAAIVWLANTTSSACEFMCGALIIVALAILAIGIITGSTALLVASIVIAVIALLLGCFMQFGQQIMGSIYVVGSWFVNVWNWAKAGFINAFQECKAKFWDFVSAVYSGVLKVANLINKVLGVFGIKIDTSSLESAINTAKGNAASNRANKVSDQSFKSGWASSAYSKGAAKGAEWQNSINNFGTNLKNKVSGFSIGNLFGELSNDFGKFTSDKLGVSSSLPNINDPALGVGGGYDPSKALKGVGGDVGDIKGNTGKIADSMELTQEDLEYLRDVANMEWKKEFTTATIQVDMSNYNTVSGDSDLDGIVTKLADRLYEELDMVAKGVYA
jgi:tape measure domain-containing protein